MLGLARFGSRQPLAACALPQSICLSVCLSVVKCDQDFFLVQEAFSAPWRVLAKGNNMYFPSSSGKHALCGISLSLSVCQARGPIARVGLYDYGVLRNACCVQHKEQDFNWW